MSTPAAQVVDTLDQQKIRFIDVNGVRTRYYEDGAGEPLFLFSGGQFGMLYSLDSWSLNLPGLAEYFHVYAVDKIGQGHSDNPKSDADYTFETVAQHAYDFIRAVGVTKGHLVGHSRSGHLISWLALEHPELVKTLIIVDSATLAPESPIFPSMRFYDNLPTLSGPPTGESVRIEPDAQAIRREHVTDDFVKRLLEIARLPNFQEATMRMDKVGATVWTPSVDRKRQEAMHRIEENGLPVPALMVWGLNDRSAPLPLGLQLFERIAAKTPRSELHVLNGAGHYSFRDQPEAFNRVVRSFCLG